MRTTRVVGCAALLWMLIVGITSGAGSEVADAAQNGDKAQNTDEARIRLQFTSPTKPALITGSTGDGDEPAPDYRYLVVPLRTLAGA